jgi:hypothetical protein
MSNIDKAAEHLGANALKMIKLILLKHDAAIIEASQEAIEAAVLVEREACANVVLSIANDDAGNPYKQALRIGAEAIRARGRA